MWTLYMLSDCLVKYINLIDAICCLECLVDQAIRYSPAVFSYIKSLCPVVSLVALFFLSKMLKSIGMLGYTRASNEKISLIFLTYVVSYTCS